MVEILSLVDSLKYYILKLIIEQAIIILEYLKTKGLAKGLVILIDILS